jgi:DNA topoisomerase I
MIQQVPAAGAALDEIPSELSWSTDRTPGIRRRRAGRGFVFRAPDGRRVTDPETLARLKALAVPPAWTDVWICADPSGHLQATGRDAKGRKQYRYHRRFRAHRDEAKFERLWAFGNALPEVRRRVSRDLTLPGMPKEKVVATVVRLLEATLVRVGNEEYARSNGSYGLTTLRDRHARFTSSGVHLVFTGKHGRRTDIAIQDRRLRAIVKRSQDLPGQTLFQYVGDDGDVRPISSTDVNEYLRDTTGAPVTAKDFRTWLGTLLATVAFAALPAPRSERSAAQAVGRVCEVVSDHLGNTPTVCRSSYIHPTIVEWYKDGSLPGRWEHAPARGSAQLVAEERKLLALLRPVPATRVRRRAA